ncbi:AtpZ/AtpI family protein [Planctomicrobium sp. SH661]|uniref:AtpZ/AtpI family protein n=1 Tax=Planctomicrobium sp. SH661 TaxID=3448124 RepID=UPI003F5C9054
MRGSKSSLPRGATFWATQLTSVAFEVAFFVMLGFWGDQRWGTTPWLLLGGSLFGLMVSSWHLWQMVQSLNRADRDSKKLAR